MRKLLVVLGFVAGLVVGAVGMLIYIGDQADRQMGLVL